MYIFITLAVLLFSARSDVYLHSPRGSNNKINEQSNNVQNDRRLFDSQNNAAAGYQVGDSCIPNCLDENNQYDRNAKGAGEGVMQFYEGSKLYISCKLFFPFNITLNRDQSAWKSRSSASQQLCHSVHV